MQNSGDSDAALESLPSRGPCLLVTAVKRERSRVLNPKPPRSGAQACAHLSRLTADLEAAAHPALDALTKKVSTHSLERVRRIKTRLVRLKTRAETVRL